MLYTCTYDSITQPFTYSNFHFRFNSSTRVLDKVLDRVLEMYSIAAALLASQFVIDVQVYHCVN